MDHNRFFPAHGARASSHRLHRRGVEAPRRVCQPAGGFEGPDVSELPRTLVRLSDAVVRQAGMLELLAAEMRIAELETALAEALAAASTDELTGLFNRRGFQQAFERERASNGTPMALAMIDLDDFKQINDRLGHEVGDQALVHLAYLLRSHLRPADIVGRHGGEEFVILFPETSLADAGTALARLQQALRGSHLLGAAAALTFSGGLVALERSESLQAALQRADSASYAAKRAGKNRIVVA